VEPGALGAGSNAQNIGRQRCKVTETGYLTACAVVSESPEGMGFGTAALRLADRFRLKEPVEGSELDIPITWFTC